MLPGNPCPPGAPGEPGDPFSPKEPSFPGGPGGPASPGFPGLPPSPIQGSTVQYQSNACQFWFILEYGEHLILDFCFTYPEVLAILVIPSALDLLGLPCLLDYQGNRVDLVFQSLPI
jgi:hypothetical protein